MGRTLLSAAFDLDYAFDFDSCFLSFRNQNSIRASQEAIEQAKVNFKDVGLEYPTHTWVQVQ